MNEQALNDAYQYFVKTGYNGTLNDYRNLISTNQNALNDSFNHFKATGYNGSIEDFSTLVGVGKTQGAAGDDAAVASDTDSASADGSLALPPINHITDDENWIDNFSRQEDYEESSLVDALNDFYKTNNAHLYGAENDPRRKNNSIRFVEAKAGKDAVEVLIGDQEEGEGRTFNFDGGGIMGQWSAPFSYESGWWNTLLGRGGESYSNKEQLENLTTYIKNETDVEHREKTVDAVLDLLGDNSQAVFGGDSAQDKQDLMVAIDNAVNGIRPQIPEGAAEDETFSVDNFMSTGWDLYKETVLHPISFGLFRSPSEEEQTRVVSGSEGPAEFFGGPTLSGILGQMGADSREIDMSGSLELEDGTIIPYKYIYDNRDLFQNALIDRRAQERTNEGIERDGETVLKIDEDNPLTGIEDSGYGRTVRLDLEAHSEKTIDSFMDSGLLSLVDTIKLIADDSNDEFMARGMGSWTKVHGGSKFEKYSSKEEALIDLNKKFEERLKESGIEPLWQNDDPDSGFIDIKRTTQAIKNASSEEAEQMELDAETLAADNDLYTLYGMMTDKYDALFAEAELALDQVGRIDDETNFVKKWGHGMFDDYTMGIIRGMEDFMGTPEEQRRDDEELRVHMDSFQSDILNLKKMVESGNLEGLAQIPELPGNSEIARRFNQTKKELLTLSRAVSMNSDPSQLQRDTLVVEVFDDLTESFTGERFFSDFTRNDQVEAFGYMMEEAGYSIPDRDPTFVEGFTSGEAALTNLRRGTEATLGVITDMAPLLVELAVMKRISPTFVASLGRSITRTGLKAGRYTQRFVHTFSKTSGRKLPKWYKSMLSNVVAPGAATTAEWAIAETAGEKLFGWEGQTINWETGETNLMFPFAMGASGAIFQRSRQAIWEGLKKNYPKTAAKLNSFTDVSLTDSKFKKALMPYTNVIGKSVGQGATATALLTTAEAINMNVTALMERGELASAQEWKDLLDPEHLMTTFAAMTLLSGHKVLPEFRELKRQQVLLLDNNTAASQKAAKDLGIGKGARGKDGTYKSDGLTEAAGNKNKAIDKQAEKEKQKVNKRQSKQIEKINNNNRLSAEQKQNLKNAAMRKGAAERRAINEKTLKEKKAIEDKINTLKDHNMVIAAQKTARSQGKYNEWLLEMSESMRSSRTRNLTSEEREAYSKLDHGDMEMMLYMRGVERGSAEYNWHMGYQRTLQRFTKLADGYIVHDGNGNTQRIESPFSKANKEARRQFIEKGVQRYINEARIQALKAEMRASSGNAEITANAKAEIKRLETENKAIEERLEVNEAEYKSWIEKRVKSETLAAEVMSKQLGAKDFKSLPDAEYRAEMKRRGLDPDSEGVFTKDGEIILNEAEMRKMVSIGAPVHELMHNILKRSLKEIDPTDPAGKRTRISADGKRIINEFLDRLPESERKALDERMEVYKNYEYTKAEWKKVSASDKKMYNAKEVNGKIKAELKEEYWYEEYITVHGQNLKEGGKFNRSAGEVIYSIFKRFAPNLGKGRIGGTRSIESGKELLNLLKDTHVTSEAIRKEIEAGRAPSEVIKDYQAAVERLKVDGTGPEATTAQEARKRIKRRAVKVTGKEGLSPEYVSSRTRELGRTTNEAWEKGGADAAIKEMQSRGFFDNLIASKYKGAKVPVDFVPKVYSEITAHIKAFKPEANDNLFGWINSQISNKATRIYNTEYKPKEEMKRAKQLDARTPEGAPLIQVEAAKDARVTAFESMDMSPQAVAAREKLKAEGEAEQVIKSALKDFIVKRNLIASPDLKIENIKQSLKNKGVEVNEENIQKERGRLQTEFINKFRNAVNETFKKAGSIDAVEKNKPFVFRDNIETSFQKIMFKDVKNALGTREVYKEFIESKEFFDIVNDLNKDPSSRRQLIKAKMDFAYEKVIDPTTGKQERMSTQEMRDALYPETYDFGAAPGKFKSKNFTQQDLIDWAEGKDVTSPSTRGTRKDAIARILSVEITKDAIPTALRNPFVQTYSPSGKPIVDPVTKEPVKIDLLEGLSMQQKTNIATSALKGSVLKIINRDPNVMFSKKEKVKEWADNMDTSSISDRILEINKPENADIKKILDIAYTKMYGTDYIQTLKDARLTIFTEHNLKYLKAEEAKELLENPDDIITRLEISRTEQSFSNLIDTWNASNPKMQLTYQKMSGKQSWLLDAVKDPITNRTQAEEFFKRQGDIFDLLPEEFVTNSGILNLLFKTGGQGKVKTYFNAEGKARVKPKPDGNVSYMKDNFGKVLKGSKEKVPTIIDSKGNKRSLLDAFKVVQTGPFKKARAEFHEKNKNLSEAEYQKKLLEWGRKRVAQSGFTWEQTHQANEYVRNKVVETLTKYVFDSKISAKERAARFDQAHKLLSIQTIINDGAFKGLNTMRYVTLDGPTVSKYNPSGYHAEHAFFNLAHSATLSNLWMKHMNKGGKGGNTKELMKDYKTLELEQYTIQESLRQLNEGKQYDKAGNLVETKSNTGFEVGGNAHPMLNVLTTNPLAAFRTLDMKTGKTVGEMLTDTKIGTGAANRLYSQAAEIINEIAQGKEAVEKTHENRGKQLVETGMHSKKAVKEMSFEERKDAIEITNKAFQLGRRTNAEKKGMSTFDFDETLIIKGENFVTATRGKETKRISSEEFPIEGPALKAEGWKFDFKDFVNVKGGQEGPLLQKLKNQIAKYGNKNVFVLTARQMEAAPAIHEWLKSKGVNLPIENITGLGKSEGSAKAQWMLEKFSEGYNDMYFVDDAMSNVKAVKKVLDQLDIKSKVQQARYSKKERVEIELNDILEHSLGIDAAKRFSKAEGRMRGAKEQSGLKALGGLFGGRRKLFVPDTAADLELLLEPLFGKGRKGIEAKEWFQENLIRKYERGTNDYNVAKQRLAREYQALRKVNKDVVKNMNKEVPGTSFTHDMAMRVYLWNKAGFAIPDLAETTRQKLVEYVEQNPQYKAYAESVARISGVETGLRKPSEHWWSETLASELGGSEKSIKRQDYIQDYIEWKNEIFSEQNLNKMEAKLGKKWRDTIEDMFDRMETGRTRSEKLSGSTGKFVNYINGSVGAIMNWNTRSATLQMISAANFVNTTFNNPARAAAAFANQKQFWKDFMTIMNSDMLKQRRAGLELNVTEAELADAANSKNPIEATFSKFIKAGYIPTKFADSFAISLGGATFYRNSIKKYMKQGMTKAQAEKQAWIDFQAISERTQQSNRPDLISREQTTLAGRFILPFANTPMQMNRHAAKEIFDIAKGRYKSKAELAGKLGKVGYYGFVQTAIFAGLSSGAFAFLMNSDDEEEISKKNTRMRDTVMDSTLRGMGIKGAVLNGVINSIKEFFTQQEKGYAADYSEVAEDLLNISPPLGSKFRKLDQAGNIYKYNREEIDEYGVELHLESPALESLLLTTEAITNIPLHRFHRKATNLDNAINGDFEVWQRVLMALGWSGWDVAPEQMKEEKDSKKSNNKNNQTQQESLPPGWFRDSEGILRKR